MSLVCNEGLASLAIESLETIRLGYFIYTYDAAGTKLREEFFNPGGASQWYMDYDGEFVYKNNTLQFILHEEGRVMARNAGTAMTEYQFSLKDHLGNTRVSFTGKRRAGIHTATYEDASWTAESATFSPSHATAVRLTAYNRTPGGAKSQRLSAANQNETIGLAKGFKVVPGDTLNVEVYARYNTPTGTNSSVAGFMFAAVTGAFGVTSSSTGEGGLLYNAFSAMNGAGTLLNSGSGVDNTKPKAYLNYIMFDDNYIPYDFGFDQVSAAAAGAWERLVLQARPRKAGFVYIYLSNEHDKVVAAWKDTFFDDLRIDYTHSPVVQGDDYYPFGAPYNSYVSGLKNDYKYNGKELQDELDLNVYDYGARFYDPYGGPRFWTVDPKAHLLPSWSPYAFGLNNPVLFIDPDGQFPYTFHVRSFHPDATFGGGFMGDNRGFSNNPSSSARIAQRFTFDPSTGQSSNKGFASNFSMHPAGFVGSATGQIPLPSSMFIGRETPSETNFDVTGGNGSYNISTGYAGANPLTPGFITPDIDVHSNFSITENLEKGILSIGASIKGDNFPSAESFLTDQAGNSVFIGVSSLSGSVLTSLWGDNYRDMINANFNINIDDKGTFTGITVGDKSFTLEDWNKQFETQSTK